MAQLDKTILPGYMTKWGNKNVINFDWVGPTLYATGGIEITADELGIGGIDSGFGGASQSGTYIATVRKPSSGAAASVYIMISLAVDGAEAGAIDLDAEIFNLTLVGV